MKGSAKATIWLLLLVFACFIGVFSALRIDRWLGQRSDSPIRFHEAIETARPADFEIQSASFDFRGAARKLIPTVVSVDRIERQRGFFDDQVRSVPTGTGSGVIISDDGYVLTNSHVVAGADQVQVRLTDDRNFRAKVIGMDSRSDLALIKIDARDLPAAELADSSKLEIGEWVLAVGNPLGYSNTVSVGVVSSMKRTLETEGGLLVDAIQTDAAINQGNSGGALANAKGQVVGINSAIATNTGGSIGLGFAIPINRAKKVVGEIMKFGHVRYGDIGAVPYWRPGLLYYESARDQMREYTGTEPPNEGLIVRRIIAGSGAAKAGLKELDVLLEVDGKKVELPVDLMKALMDHRAGDTVKVKYWSKGQVKSATIQLQELL